MEVFCVPGQNVEKVGQNVEKTRQKGWDRKVGTERRIFGKVYLYWGPERASIPRTVPVWGAISVEGPTELHRLHNGLDT